MDVLKEQNKIWDRQEDKGYKGEKNLRKMLANNNKIIQLLIIFTLVCLLGWYCYDKKNSMQNLPNTYKLIASDSVAVKCLILIIY